MIEGFLGIVIAAAGVMLALAIGFGVYSVIDQRKNTARHRGELADELASKGDRLREWQDNNADGVGR